jgi:hypothetical protein
MIDKFDEGGSALNSIILSPRIAAWFHCSSSDILWYPEQFIDVLLAESGIRLFIPSWEVEHMDMNLNNLSKIAKNHIEIVDKNHKIFSEIKSIVREIEINLNRKNDISNDLNYSLNRLFESLYHIRLATKYNVDCDISRPLNILEEIELLLENTNNKEIKSFISEFIGMLKLYRNTKITTNIFYKSITDDIEKRFNDIIVDSTFLRLSTERKKLSISRDISLISEIKLLARKLSMKKTYKDFIGLSNIPISLLPQRGKKIGESISNFLKIDKSFSPPIVDIDEVADSTLRRLNPPPQDISTGRTEFYPYSLYDFSRNLVYKL